MRDSVRKSQMSHRLAPSYVSLCLIFVLSLLQVASGQPTIYANITNVDVTSYVLAGKPLIVTVTVSYSYLTISEESLLVSILNRAANGTPFPTTSSDPSCYVPQNVSVCFAIIPNIPRDPLPQGTFTASFMLTAPSTAETWDLYVVAQIVVLNSSLTTYDVVTSESKMIPITVAAS